MTNLFFIVLSLAVTAALVTQVLRKRGRACGLCLVSLALLLSGCGGDQAFRPDTVRITSAISSQFERPSTDADDVNALYALYTQAEKGDAATAPDRVWSMTVEFADSAGGRTLCWEVCRDGSASDDGAQFFALTDGKSVYSTIKAYYDQLSDVEGYARELYGLKIPYIGDASADGALLSALGIEQVVGAYTLTLQTQSEPYGITLNLTPAGSGLAVSDIDLVMGRYGYLFLALVDNAQVFSWNYETPAGGHHSSVYSRGADVKQYSESLARFTELCTVIDGLSAVDMHPADVSVSTGSESYIMRGAPAAQVSALWDMVNGLTLEKLEPEQTPSQEQTISLCFYDSKGAVLSTWSFFGNCCRVDGQEQLYQITGGSLETDRIRALYESSKTSEEYQDGQYAMSEVFAGG